MTFVGAVQAVRGVIWFALAVAAVLPAALDGLLTRPDPSSRRVNLAISSVSLAGLAVALLVTLAQPQSWFSQEWPEDRVAAVREATRDPTTKLWATDRTADWLLWSIPDLRGRIASDARFELYDEKALEKIIRYGTRRGDWTAVVDGYRAVVVDDAAHLRAIASEAGSAVIFRDDEIAVVSRR